MELFFFFTFLLQFVFLFLHLCSATAEISAPNQPTLSRIHSFNQGTSLKNSHQGLKNYDIILNPRFEDGLDNWSCKSCKLLLRDSTVSGEIPVLSGKFFASATNRTGSWNGIEQEITSRVSRKLAYEVNATIRISGNDITNAIVKATLWVQNADGRQQYIHVGSVQATDKEWEQLQGKFLLNDSPMVAVIFLEGPPPDTDILVSSFFAEHARRNLRLPKPVSEKPVSGVNIVENSNLEDGTNRWFPLGGCSLSIATGSPVELPPMARNSLGPQKPLNGRYILVTNRTDTWMGPAQMISNSLKPFLTYQVSAWVRIGSGTGSPQLVNVAVSMDGNWINGGQVECTDERWFEIGGSFRIEKTPIDVMVYVQGPSANVDLMVAGLQIFPVDRKARFKYLRRQTEKIRKRDVILKFPTSKDSGFLGESVKVTQMRNSFPLGTCIQRSSIDNERFTDFLLKNFNWVVFENELKWTWTEPEQGRFNYNEADELLEFCLNNSLQVRGHCVFWEVDYAIQSWIKSLNGTELNAAVQTRLSGLMERYKGKFRHYDVDNEMLHGSFYPDRLGRDIQAKMFKTAHQIDPSAALFTNDFHIEDGIDVRSSPERYIEQILKLETAGAKIGGIGIQGHVDFPVGPIVASALDKLGTLGLPIWFTELDVSSRNEYVRADDLEVMIREAFAHPAVEGVMLWGFWELYMSREDAFLVDAEGKINEAGRRFLALKKEWLTNADGLVDSGGEFRFRGFHGSYNVEIGSGFKRISREFVVEEGERPLEVTVQSAS